MLALAIACFLAAAYQADGLDEKAQDKFEQRRRGQWFREVAASDLVDALVSWQ